MPFAVNTLLASFLSLLAVGQALSIPEVIDEVATLPSILSRNLEARAGKKCPKVWQSISTELTAQFAGCNQFARTSIRFAFHDAGGYSSLTPFYPPASGGADGSLLLNDDEMARPSQQPMGPYRDFLRGIYDTTRPKISAADLIQFAGAVGLKSCEGPSIKAVVGRKDTKKAAPEGLLPAPFGANANFDTIMGLFSDKGFNAVEVAALMGAHTVSRAFASQFANIPEGGPQDTTPTKWDQQYFQQVQEPPAGVFPFQSDIALSNPNTTVGEAMEIFAADKAAWDSAFIPAMEKLSVLGIDQKKINRMKDCTGSV